MLTLDGLKEKLDKLSGEHEILFYNHNYYYILSNNNSSYPTNISNNLDSAGIKLFPVVVDKFKVNINNDNRTRVYDAINSRSTNLLEDIFSNKDSINKLILKYRIYQPKYTADQIYLNYETFFRLPYYQTIIKLNDITYQINWDDLITLSIINSNNDVFQEIIPFVNPNITTRNNISLFHLTVIYAQLDNIKSLINQISSNKLDKYINTKSENGLNALHYAVRYNYFDIAEYLISLGINIDERDNNGGKTPLLYAIMNNYQELINLLVENGADLTLTFQVSLNNGFYNYNYSEMITEIYFNGQNNTETRNALLELVDLSVLS